MARGVVADSDFLRVAELLPQAAEQMVPAEEGLGRHQPREALPPEQRAPAVPPARRGRVPGHAGQHAAGRWGRQRGKR